MLVKCRVCQHILGEQTDEGILVRQECHKDLLIEGCVRIKCDCGYENLIQEKA